MFIRKSNSVCSNNAPDFFYLKETAIATHANLHGVAPEKEMRLRELYERLDMDNDGTIDIRDLTTALKHEVPHIPTVLAPVSSTVIL